MEFILVQLQAYRTSCISTINRLHHRFFKENVPKTNCLKRTFVTACKNLLIKCSPAGHSPQFYHNFITLDLTEEFWCVHMKASLVETSFHQKMQLKSQSQRFHQKRTPPQRFFGTGFCKISLFKISESFLWGAALIIFVREAATLLKLTSLECTVQPVFTYSNLTIETLEHCVKYVQS